MAYGIEMAESEFKDFLFDPDKNCRQAFTLRLRPSLAKGSIERPEASKGIKYMPTEKLHDVNSKESISIEDQQQVREAASRRSGSKWLRRTSGTQAEAKETVKKKKEKAGLTKGEEEEEDDDESFVFADVEEAIRETLGEEVAMYLHPREAGQVKLAGGKTMPVEAVERALPRLSATRMRLHIVRREKLKKWTVYHIGLIEPRLRLKDGTEVELKSYRSPSGEAPPAPGPEEGEDDKGR
jgi:hypothetical protein